MTIELRGEVVSMGDIGTGMGIVLDMGGGRIVTLTGLTIEEVRAAPLLQPVVLTLEVLADGGKQ
jgi:hypothetical protein